MKIEVKLLRRRHIKLQLQNIIFMPTIYNIGFYVLSLLKFKSYISPQS